MQGEIIEQVEYDADQVRLKIPREPKDECGEEPRDKQIDRDA
jgi:hypothetical protein